MLGDPLQPPAPQIPRVDWVAGPVTRYRIGDELHVDPVVLERVVELVGLAYRDAFVAGIRQDEGGGPDLVCLGYG